MSGHTINYKMRYVTLAEKRHPVSFNMAALYEVEKFCDMSLGEIFEELANDPTIMLRLNFLGLKFGADEAGKKFNWTYSQFVEVTHNNEEFLEELTTMVSEDFKIILELETERLKLAADKSKGKGDAKKKKPSGPST